MTKGLKSPQSELWASDQFTIIRNAELRDPSMLARGISANLTGSRADIVICDDVEVPNTCNTLSKRQDLRERLAEIDYILVPNGMQIFVGTPHSFFSIYADIAHKETGEKQAFLQGFNRLKIAIKTQDGKPVWPERYNLTAIEDLKLRHGENKFNSQMMLQPISLDAGRLSVDNLRHYNSDICYEERNQHATLLIDNMELISASSWWDPSYGAAGKGDSSVIACVFTSIDGRYWLHDIKYLTTDNNIELDEARQQCNQVADFIENNYLPAVTIETNGIGKFLPGLLRNIFQSRGLSCAIIEHHNHKPKAQRIISAFDAVMAAGNLMAHDKIWNSQFITEMRQWTPANTHQAVDDGLDAVAGCLQSEPVRLVRVIATNPCIQTNINKWHASGKSHKANGDFNP